MAHQGKPYAPFLRQTPFGLETHVAQILQTNGLIGDNPAHMLYLEFPDKLQYAQHRHHDPRQSRPNGDQADGFLLKLIEPIAKAAKLAFHSIVAIFASDDDLNGEQATVYDGDPVPNILAAEITALGQFVKRGGFYGMVSVHALLRLTEKSLG